MKVETFFSTSFEAITALNGLNGEIDKFLMSGDSKTVVSISHNIAILEDDSIFASAVMVYTEE